MKTRRIIYFSLGILLILLNILVDIVNPDGPNRNDDSYNIGYFLGSHVIMIIGLILLGFAYKLHKKIKRTNENNDLKDSIERLGK